MNDLIETTERVNLPRKTVDFRELVKNNHDMLVRVAQSIVGEDNAEEVVQEAWISIYKNIGKFEGLSTLKTWMCRITANKAISFKRKKKDPAESNNNEDSEAYFYNRFSDNGTWNKPIKNWHESSPEKILSSQELQECIEEVMAELPKKQKICFYLSHFENENIQSISLILNESQSNIKVLIHRARIKLFEHITNFQENGGC